jgi:rhodanese-related sulfurtransferase
MPRLRFALATVVSAVLVVGLSACSPGKLDISNVAGIIDTRPKAEFFKEHLVGSINIDYSTGDFIALTTDLPKNAKYLVYGSTDEQATAAVQAMFNRGYADVTNLGTYQNAVEMIDLPVIHDSKE